MQGGRPSAPGFVAAGRRPGKLKTDFTLPCCDVHSAPRGGPMRWGFVLLAVTVLCGLSSERASAQQWPPPPIGESERTLSRPLVDPTADAEVLLWDVTITDKIGRAH